MSEITVRKINKAVRDTQFSLYMVCKDGNHRVMGASKNTIELIGGKWRWMRIVDCQDAKFIDGRSGKDYYV